MCHPSGMTFAVVELEAPDSALYHWFCAITGPWKDDDRSCQYLNHFHAESPVWVRRHPCLLFPFPIQDEGPLGILLCSVSHLVCERPKTSSHTVLPAVFLDLFMRLRSLL